MWQDICFFISGVISGGVGMLLLMHVMKSYRRSSTQSGSLTFLALPPEHETDFSCSPPGLLSLDEAQQIARLVADGVAAGQIGDVEWRRDD